MTVENKETGEQLFRDKIGPNGEITTTLNYGTYAVAVEDVTRTVKLDGDTEIILDVVTSSRNRPSHLLSALRHADTSLLCSDRSGDSDFK